MRRPRREGRRGDVLADPEDGQATLVLDPPAEAAPEAPARRRRPVRRVLLVGALGAGLWWAGWSSPATRVEHVVVSAPRGISEAAVRLASGITASDNVPGVSADEVRAAIMTELPAVASVDVSRSLPHTIEVSVTARTPFAAVASGKGFYVMDVEGVVFDRVAKPGSLPIIRSRSDVARDAAHSVLLSIPEELRSTVERVTASTRDDVTLILRDSAVVRWGSVEEAELKARVLAGLLPVRATRYDVSAPLLPTTAGTLPTED